MALVGLWSAVDILPTDCSREHRVENRECDKWVAWCGSQGPRQKGRRDVCLCPYNPLYMGYTCNGH
jgi:hypothetical protein